MTARPPIPAHPRLGTRLAYRLQRVLRPRPGLRWLSARIEASGLARPLFTDPDWAAKVADGRLDAIRTCPCDPPTCLRTQLDGAVCSHWPPAAVDRGYLGYDD